MRRDLFVTAAMLQRAGLDVDLRLDNGTIFLRVEEHRSEFPASNAEQAADWLAACVVIHYPESALAKLWVMLATAAGGAIPFGSR